MLILVKDKLTSNRISFLKTKMYYKEKNKQDKAVPLIISILLHVLMFFVLSFPTTRVPNFKKNTEQTLKIQYIAAKNKTVVSKSEVRNLRSEKTGSPQTSKQNIRKQQKESAALPSNSVGRKSGSISRKSAKLKKMKAIKPSESKTRKKFAQAKTAKSSEKALKKIKMEPKKQTKLASRAEKRQKKYSRQRRKSRKTARTKREEKRVVKKKKTTALPRKSVEHKRANISRKSAKLKKMKAIKPSESKTRKKFAQAKTAKSSERALKKIKTEPKKQTKLASRAEKRQKKYTRQRRKSRKTARTQREQKIVKQNNIAALPKKSVEQRKVEINNKTSVLSKANQSLRAKRAAVKKKQLSPKLLKSSISESQKRLKISKQKRLAKARITTRKNLSSKMLHVSRKKAKILEKPNETFEKFEASSAERMSVETIKRKQTESKTSKATALTSKSMEVVENHAQAAVKGKNKYKAVSKTEKSKHKTKKLSTKRSSVASIKERFEVRKNFSAPSARAKKAAASTKLSKLSSAWKREMSDSLDEKMPGMNRVSPGKVKISSHKTVNITSYAEASRGVAAKRSSTAYFTSSESSEKAKGMGKELSRSLTRLASGSVRGNAGVSGPSSRVRHSKASSSSVSGGGRWGREAPSDGGVTSSASPEYKSGNIGSASSQRSASMNIKSSSAGSGEYAKKSSRAVFTSSEASNSESSEKSKGMGKELSRSLTRLASSGSVRGSGGVSGPSSRVRHSKASSSSVSGGSRWGRETPSDGAVTPSASPEHRTYGSAIHNIDTSNKTYTTALEAGSDTNNTTSKRTYASGDIDPLEDFADIGGSKSMEDLAKSKANISSSSRGSSSASGKYLPSSLKLKKGGADLPSGLYAGKKWDDGSGRFGGMGGVASAINRGKRMLAETGRGLGTSGSSLMDDVVESPKMGVSKSQEKTFKWEMHGEKSRRKEFKTSNHAKNMGRTFDGLLGMGENKATNFESSSLFSSKDKKKTKVPMSTNRPSGGLAGSRIYKLKGKLQDDTFVSANIFINGVAQLSLIGEDGSFSSILPLKPGINEVQIYAVSPKGKKSESKFQLWLPPDKYAEKKIYLTSPENGTMRSLNDKIMVRGVVDDKNLREAKLYVNDSPRTIKLNDGRFSVEVGVEGFKTCKFRVEAQAPNGELYSSNETTILIGADTKEIQKYNQMW